MSVPATDSHSPPTTAVGNAPAADVQPVDLRIHIGDHCGFDFRHRVVTSGSNTLGAIYFRSDHLQTIATHLGITVDAGTKADAYAAIRDALGLSSRDGRPFTTQELATLALALGIDRDTLAETVLAVRVQQISGGLLTPEYLYRLIDGAHCDVYLSANDGGRIGYPWKMLPVHEVSMAYRESAEWLIVDSSIKEDDIGNRDALDTALEVEADGVVLADVWHDVDATVGNVVDGVAMAEAHPFDGEVIIPLQPPAATCLDRLLAHDDITTDYTFAIGGMKDASTAEQLAEVRSVREAVGYDIELHGLGFGVTDRLAAAIRDDPGLLDSVDSSTRVQNEIHDTKSGDERLSIVAANAGVRLLEDLRRLSEFVDSGPVATELDDFGTE